MTLKLADHLSDIQSKQLERLKSSKKKKQERINWPEIMGMNRDIYKRKNGAIRRK
jgi:hypothetical protein